MIQDQRLADVKQRIKDHVYFSMQLTDLQLKQLIDEELSKLSFFVQASTRDKLEMMNRLFYSFRGLDVLQTLLSDQSISEIMVNNEQSIFIERNGEITQADVSFESRERLEDIIQQIVSSVNRVVNESSPVVDARLADGSRVNIVLPPIALKGPCMTIRKFPMQAMTMEHLISIGSITEEAAQFLQQLVQAKFNIFIGGGTGSGKTTFLNVLANFIPKDERIITIEDAAELRIESIPNLVSLETRNANTEGKGEVSIRDLIRSSLRMRPNRIIVGEVRGKESLDMLQAMNTGHEGSMSTGHANNVRDMLSRLETMVLSGNELPLAVVRKQICSAIDIMVHLSRFSDHTRGVVEISQLIGLENGEINVQPLYELSVNAQTGERRLIRTEYPIYRKYKFDFM